ncbi:MAG TPA: hypothetical protein VH134_11600 [Candidatus Dormibacteraeota bacterium]|jgi:hypothetical protein|nr:hypothetical protein [Candidatus Dormibacteraeota bacterium]
MGLSLLRLVGLVLAAVGAGMAVAPGLTRRVLLFAGVRWEPDPRSRVASWALVILGLVVVLLSRLVR